MKLTAIQKANKLIADNEKILEKRFKASSSVHTAKELAQITVNNVMDSIPMYTGSLNPEWIYWRDVRIAINALWY